MLYPVAMFLFASCSLAAKYGALDILILCDTLVYMRKMSSDDGISIVDVAQRLVDSIFELTGVGVTVVYSMPDLFPSFAQLQKGPLYIDMLKFANAKLPWTYNRLLVASMGNDAYLIARNGAGSTSVFEERYARNMIYRGIRLATSRGLMTRGRGFLEGHSVFRR